MVRLCGAALGFLAFAVTILLSLAAGNTVEVTLLRAVWAMLVFCVIGWFVGWIAWRVLDEHALGKYREMFVGLDEEPVETGSDTGPASGRTQRMDGGRPSSG